jgi:hypothetical protein
MQLLSVLCQRFAGLAALLLAVVSLADAEHPRFAEILVDAGFKLDHPALVARLEGNDSYHLVLAGQDRDFTQRISIYRIEQGDGAEATLVAQLSPEPDLIAYDVARIGDRDALMFIAPGRILRYDLVRAEFGEYLQVSSFYRQNRTGAIAPLDFFRDLNQDGRDDLIIPDIDGYRVRLQDAKGQLTAESVLQDSVVMNLSGGNVRFDGRNLFSGDMNFDDLVDLGFWRGDTLGVYRKLPDLRYQEEPLTRPSGLGVLSEAENRALEDGMGAVDQKGLTERDIESIKELNGDGIPDIIAEATHSEGMFDRRNEFSLHLGRQNGDQVEYAPEGDAMIAFEGIQFDLISTDIDGDGKQDLVVRKAKLSFGRIIRALFSGSVPIEIHFHKMSEKDTYEEDANFVAKTKVRFSRSSGQVDIPAIAVDDFDGDGLQDLVVQSAPDHLGFYDGEPTDQLFAKKPASYEIDLPRNGELVSAQDINDDGRADLLLRYNESDADGMVNKVRVLLSVPAN